MNWYRVWFEMKFVQVVDGFVCLSKVKALFFHDVTKVSSSYLMHASTASSSRSSIASTFLATSLMTPCSRANHWQMPASFLHAPRCTASDPPQLGKGGMGADLPGHGMHNSAQDAQDSQMVDSCPPFPCFYAFIFIPWKDLGRAPRAGRGPSAPCRHDKHGVLRLTRRHPS